MFQEVGFGKMAFFVAAQIGDRLYRDHFRITSNVWRPLRTSRRQRLLGWGSGLLLLGMTAGCLPPEPMRPDAPEYVQWEALQMDPANELGYLRLAARYQERGLRKAAEQTLQAGLQNVPDSERLASALGRFYLTQNQLKQAQAFYSNERLQQSRSAYLYLDRAQLRVQTGDSQAALEDLSQALKLNPELAEAWFWKGMLHSRLQQTSAALDAFEEAARYNSQQASIWQQIAMLQKQLGRPLQSRQALETALRLEPHDYPLLQMYSSLLEEALEKGETDVLESLRQTLLVMQERFPEDAWTLAHLGTVLWQSGAQAEGRRLLQSSLALKPNYTWAQFRLGLLYLSSKRWEDASFWLQQGLQENPDNPWALHQLANCYEQQGRTVEAIALFDSWLKSPERQTLPLYQAQARLYLNELRFDDYEQLQLKALQRFPQSQEVIQELAAYYQGTRQPRKAHSLLLRLLPQEARNEELQLKLAQLEQAMGLNGEAEERLHRALEQGLQSENLHRQWIELRQARLEPAEVIPDLLEMFAHYPESEWAAQQLAQLYLLEERYAAAEEVLHLSLDQHPEATSLRLLKGRLSAIKGQWEEALVALQPLEGSESDTTLLNHQILVYRKLNHPHIALKLAERSLLEHEWDLWTWYQLTLLQSAEEQQRWFGVRHQEVRQILDAIMSLQFGRARQQLAHLSLSPVEQELLRGLTHQLRTGQTPPTLKIELNEALQQPPWVRFQLALVAEANREFIQSEAIYRSILEEQPDHPWTHARLGSVYAELDQLERSQAHHARFLAAYPGAVWGTFQLAVLKTMQQQEPEAIKLYRQVLSLQPDHAASLNNLAWTYLTAGDPHLRNTREALDMARRAVEIRATVDHLDTLAEAYFQSGQPIEALQTIRRAILITPQDSDRYPYLLKQFNRFRQGDPHTSPPGISSAS